VNWGRWSIVSPKDVVHSGEEYETPFLLLFRLLAQQQELLVELRPHRLLTQELELHKIVTVEPRGRARGSHAELEEAA